MSQRKECFQCNAGNKDCYMKKIEKVAAESKNDNDSSVLLNNAFETHKQIAQIRIEARENLCPMVNDDRMNPNYPGKRLL